MDKNTEIKKNVPELRFPGFTDAWEQRKLGDVVDYNNGIGHEEYVLPEGKYELVTLKSINSEGKMTCSEKFVNKEFETLQKGTLIMMLSEQAKGMLGMTAIIPCNNKYILNQRVAALTLRDGIDSSFLTKAINRKQYYFEQMGAGTKVQNITKGHVENCIIEIPKYEEQLLIGNYFSNLDHLITLHQRKCDLMKEYKKGVANKLFNDVNNSESRMERLGDIINILPKTKHPAGVALSSGAYRFFTNDTGSKISYLDTFDYNTEAIIANTGGVANFKYYDGPFSVSMHCLVFEPIDPYALYLYHYLNTKKTEIDRGGFRGSGLKALDKEFLLNTIIPIPDYEIQKKIGNTLTEIDKKIACEEKMIEDMKEYKKGLLQKMFI